MSDARPMVSVCMITYNHGTYIREAVESVLAQRAPFDIELVIGEDHGTDDTAEIIKDYSRRYPGRVRARMNPENLGMGRNFLATFTACRGRYIAMLEGDDYWIDPHKLATQVEFLESNQNYAITFHPVRIWENGRIVPDRFTRTVPETTTIQDLALGNYMHTCSVVFRNGLIEQFPESFERSPVGDYFLHMLNACHGAIRRFPQEMAVYRVHDGGAWSHQRNIDLKVLDYLECMIGNFEPEVDRRLMERHKTVAARSFFARLGDTGDEERFERCLRYGIDHLVSEIAGLIQREKGTTAISRPLRKLARAVERRLASM